MPGQMLLCATLLGMLLAPSIATDGNYEPQCQSENDYGWPRFKSVDELQTSPWASYFTKAYGELPNKYPVCIYDLHALDQAAYVAAKITGKQPVDSKAVQEGDLFAGGLTGYQIYHGAWNALPDNTWVEVTHTAYPTELRGYWVWRQRGSGIWYNSGKTKVFPQRPGHTHEEAIAFLTDGCSVKTPAGWPIQESVIFGDCAREKGLDSIQFEPTEGQSPMGSFGITGLTEMVIVNIDGHYNCGVEDASKTPLRAGWLASRQFECVNYEYADSCGLMPRPPFPLSLLGSDPPLCKLQEPDHFWNRWKACDPMTCKMTACGLPKHSEMTNMLSHGALHMGMTSITV